MSDSTVRWSLIEIYRFLSHARDSSDMSESRSVWLKDQFVFIYHILYCKLLQTQKLITQDPLWRLLISCYQIVRLLLCFYLMLWANRSINESKWCIPPEGGRTAVLLKVTCGAFICLPVIDIVLHWWMVKSAVNSLWAKRSDCRVLQTLISLIWSFESLQVFQSTWLKAWAEFDNKRA